MAIVFSAKINGDVQDPYNTNNYYTGESVRTLSPPTMSSSPPSLCWEHRPLLMATPRRSRPPITHTGPDTAGSMLDLMLTHRLRHFLGRSHRRYLQPPLWCFSRHYGFDGRLGRRCRPATLCQDPHCRGGFIVLAKAVKLTSQIFGSVLGLFGLIGELSLPYRDMTANVQSDCSLSVALCTDICRS
jgi:hypothetical protein